MNREFVKKIIQAERLKYEAIKEILPDNVKKRVDSFEKEALEFLKDIAIEIIKEDASKHSEEIKNKTKKVDVEFS